MSKLTLDEAIKHCLEVAEQKEHDSITTTGDHELDIAMKEGCIQCAAEHRQLAEWLEELRARRLLMDKVCEELARLYGSPCQSPKAHDFIRENGSCNDCKISITDKECWFRYFHRKFNCRWCKADEALKLIGDE